MRECILHMFVGPPDTGVLSPSVQKTLYDTCKVVLSKIPQVLYTLITLKYYCINHGNQSLGFFNFEITTNVLVNCVSVSFIYLCYGSTAIRNILILSVRGPFLYVRI